MSSVTAGTTAALAEVGRMRAGREALLELLVEEGREPSLVLVGRDACFSELCEESVL